VKFVNPQLLDDLGNRTLHAAVGSKVKLGKKTRWLAHRMREKFPDELRGIADRGGSAMVAWRKAQKGRWMDHAGTVTKKGRDYLVSEPYGLTEDRLSELLKFAESFDLACQVGAHSYHYPTMCLQIVLYPSEWDCEDYGWIGV